ncbi:hypothetical protein BDV19DRAFT_393183 [Aspergillus venezuelensis]
MEEILTYSQKAAVAYRAPASKEEKLMQSMCADLLDLLSSALSMEENFFNVGGDSLTARQLITKARSNGMSLAVTDIFEAPNLSDLAKRMTKAGVTIGFIDMRGQGFFRGDIEEVNGGVEDTHSGSELGALTDRYSLIGDR